MTYIENTFVCLMAPLLIAVFCVRKSWRRGLLFLMAGMTCCLLSAFVSTFFIGLVDADPTMASYEFTPAIEEMIKFLPILFYILVFESDRTVSINGILMVAVGFATFENVLFMTSYGTGDLLRLLIRGFGTGAMHIVCGMIMAGGLYHLWGHPWLRAVGVFALICSAITFHAIFNLIISYPGVSLWVGSAIPIMLVFGFLLVFYGKLSHRRS